MKKLKQTLTVLFFMTFTCICNSQTFTGDVKLTTQEEVDTFGLNKYTKIIGNIVIGNSECCEDNNTDISSLNSLNSITTIEGNLYIGGYYGYGTNSNLSSLIGLNNITSISGDLTISNNNLLNNLDGLNNLTSIGGNLDINGSNVSSIGNHKLLTSFYGLNKLKTISGGLHIQNNFSLNTLSDLSNLDYIGNGLVLIGCPKIIDFTGLESMKLNGKLIISNNDALTTLKGLTGITNLESSEFNTYSLSITNNNSLKSLQGLNNVLTIDFLRISNNPSLININDLRNVNDVSGRLYIIDNEKLTSLASLKNITSIGHKGGNSNSSGWECKITGNNSLTTLYGLHNVVSTSGNLQIQNNSSLISLDLYNLTSIGRYFHLKDNPKLTTLKSLEKLESISYTFNIKNNILLSNFCGIRPLIIADTFGYEVSDNAQNPTKEEILENCVDINTNPPILTLTKEDFGDVDLGTQTTKNIAIKNTGASTLTISTITKTDTNGNFVILGNDTNISLEPNETFNFLVRLNANSIGAKEMTLHIDSNANSTTEDFVITGNVNAPESLEATKPETPTAVAIDEQAIKISWQENAEALSYRLYRNTTYNTKEQIYFGLATTFCDTKLKAETTYSYSIIIENAVGLSLFSDEVSTTTNVTPTGVTRPVADLTPVLLGIEETYKKWVEDDFIEVNLGVYNKGNTISEEVYASLSLSQTNINGANDYVLIDNIRIDKIEPSKIYNTTKYIRIPEVITGDYHLVFNVDVNNSLDDKDTYNNVKVSNKSFTIYPKSADIKADLKSSFISVPKSIIKGQEGEIEILTSNLGNQNTLGFSGGLYLSKDRFFSILDDIKIDNYFHDFLDADTNKKDIRKYTIPTTVDSGNYYFIYKTDSSEEIDELYEQNNFVPSPEKVEVLASNGIVEISGRVNVINSLYNNDVSMKDIVIDGLPGIVKTEANGTFSAPVEIGKSYKLSINNPLYLVSPVIEGSDIITNIQSDKTVDFNAVDPILTHQDIRKSTNIFSKFTALTLGNVLKHSDKTVSETIDKHIKTSKLIYDALTKEEDDITNYFNVTNKVQNYGADALEYGKVSNVLFFASDEFGLILDLISADFAKQILEIAPASTDFRIKISNSAFFSESVDPNTYKSYIDASMIAYIVEENDSKKIIAKRKFQNIFKTSGGLNRLMLSDGEFESVGFSYNRTIYNFNSFPNIKYMIEVNWLTDQFVDGKREISNRMLIPFEKDFIYPVLFGASLTDYNIDLTYDKGTKLDFKNGQGLDALKIKKN